MMDGMASLPVSPPHAEAVELHRWVLDSYDELRGLRASLHQIIANGVVSESNRLDDVFDQMSVVATELATNALDRKSTRLNSSHMSISYAVFCLKKKKKK